MNVLKKFWFEVPKPDENQLKSFVGRFVKVKDDDGVPVVVEIERIMGSLVYPTRFEIVSKGKHYHIVMLDFFAQMNGEAISDEDIKKFDETMFEVKRNKWQKKNGLIVPNKKN